MPGRWGGHNDFSDDDDRDAPQPIDLDDDGSDDADTIDCPHCGRPVYEDADRCPNCGHWIEDDSPAAKRSRSWFWPITVALLIALMLVFWLGLGR